MTEETLYTIHVSYLKLHPKAFHRLSWSTIYYVDVQTELMGYLGNFQILVCSQRNWSAKQHKIAFAGHSEPGTDTPVYVFC